MSLRFKSNHAKQEIVLRFSGRPGSTSSCGAFGVSRATRRQELRPKTTPSTSHASTGT